MNYTGRPSISGCRPVLSLYPTHRFCQYLLLIFITFTNSFLFNRAFSTNSRKRLGNNLSVKGSPFGGGAQPLRHACGVPPPLPRGGFGSPQSFISSPEAPLLGATATTAASGGNREELLGPRPAGCERQRSRRWEPQPGLVERSETERLYEGRPDREPLPGSTSPSALTRCHLPYRGEALAFHKTSPLRQRLPY